ncbi:MAG: hypothetical protein ABI142_10830, partial [Bryocella sp.]
MSRFRRHLSLAPAILFTVCTTLLSGCATNFSQNAVSTSMGHSLHGTTMGGQQPVVGANVYLYAVGTSGYGGVSRSMLSGAGYVTTGTHGEWSITNDYTCQSGDQVYLLVVGGKADGQTENAAITLAAPLGDCSALSASTFVYIDEVTTVATAYALSGFATGPAAISSSGTAQAQTGVANAFLVAASLANISHGTANAKSAFGNGNIPQAKINSLANLIAGCVDSDGSSTSPCATVFAAATPTGGTTPTDTFTALLNIAHNPSINIASLYNSILPSPPFQPSLTAMPHDWTLAIDYTGTTGDYSYNSGFAAMEVDGLGRVWMTHPNSVTLFSPTGALISPAGGFQRKDVLGLAIDTANHAWVGETSTSNNSLGQNSGEVVELDSTGTILKGPITSSGITAWNAQAMAFDSTGLLWVAGSDTGEYFFS